VREVRATSGYIRAEVIKLTLNTQTLFRWFTGLATTYQAVTLRFRLLHRPCTVVGLVDQPRAFGHRASGGAPMQFYLMEVKSVRPLPLRLHYAAASAGATKPFSNLLGLDLE